ncbi:MAG: hypothetical protein ACUVTM_01820 [Candidatus Bathyarchaeia archaeon]
MVGRLLFKTLTRPRSHTIQYMASAALLVTLLIADHQDGVGVHIMNMLVLASLSFLAMNETTVGIDRLRRDLAILLAVGVKRRILEFIMVGRAFLFNFLIFLIGAGVGQALQLLGFQPWMTIQDTDQTLVLVMLTGPALPAASYATYSISNLDVTEALRS